MAGVSITTDLKCNLNKLVEVQYLKGNMFSLDHAANIMNVHIYDGEDNPVEPGGTVTANIIRSDGTTVAVTGDITDNIAYVIFPQAVYAVPGPAVITIKLTYSESGSTTVTTIAAVIVNVYRTSTDTIVDPGTIIPSVEALINQINTVLADLPPTYTVLWQTLADPFSDAKDYKVGEYVSNDSQLWQFVAPHTAGTWNSGEVVNPVIGNDLYDIVEFTRAAEITSDLDYTTTGVTFQQTEDPTVIKMFGTCTGTRRVLFLNGLRTVKTTTSEFTKVLDEGTYYIQTDMTGYQTVYAVVGTYTTFASSSTYFTITGSSSKKNVVARFNAPVMVGFTITSGRNYGTEDNPTYFKISILKKTAVDLYSRDLVTKHGYAIDMINKRRIAFGDIDNRGTALNVDQKWNIITINGLSGATSAQASTKILLTGPLTVRNDIDPTQRELVYPIKLLEGRVYRYGLNVLSGTRTLTSSSGTGRMTMRLHNSSETELSRITLELESTSISGTIIGNGENIKVSVYVGRYLQCTDLVMDVYLEDITEEMEFAKVKESTAEITGNRAVEFYPNHFVNVTGTEPIDINANITASTVGCGCAIIDVSPGDIFTINSDGESSRAWAVFDSEGYRVSMAISNVSPSNPLNDYILRIPLGGSKLVINAKPSNGNSYYGIRLNSKVVDAVDDIDSLNISSFTISHDDTYLHRPANWVVGSGVTINDGQHFTGASYCRTGYNNITKPTLIYIEDNNYEFIVWEYSRNNISYYVYSPSHRVYSNRPVVVSSRHGGAYYKISVHKVDGTAMTSDDLATIISKLKVCTQVDNYVISKINDINNVLYNADHIDPNESATDENGLYLLAVGGFDITTGQNTTLTGRCKTAYLTCEVPLLIKFNNPHKYYFDVYGYSDASHTSGVQLYCSYNTDNEFLVIPENGVRYIRIAFAKIEYEALTTDLTDPTSDWYIIQHSLRICEYTDKSLTVHEVPADAYTVGARLAADEQDILTKADETATNTRFTAIEDILPTKADLEQTKNLWTLGDQVLTATKRIDTGVSIPFASTGRYTLSADIESEATEVTINVSFEYHEGYSVQPIATFSGLTIGGHKSATLNMGIIGGMTANYVTISLSSTPSSSITMSNIQLEFGTSATEYVPPLVPNDYIARDLATKANTRLDSVENELDTELVKKASIVVNSAFGRYVALHDGNDGSPFEEITVEFTDTIQEGSGDPSPENIRNILLYNRLSFESTGKNIFDLNNVTIVEKAYIKENGDIANHTSYNYCETYIRVMPNTKYTVSYMTNGSGTVFTVPFYDENGDFISRSIAVSAGDSVNGFNSGSFITPSNAKYFRFSYTRSMTSLSTLQIEEGDTYTDHEDFSGQHIVIPWMNNMQGLPFAGGKVIFYKDGKYSRIETRGIYTINSGSVIDECSTASTGVHYIKTVSVDNLIKGDNTLVSNQYSNVVTSAPNPGSTGMRITGNCFYIYDDRFTDLATASNLVAQNPIKIVYTLSEPIVKPARTLPNGPISTSLGNNYLWADAQVQDNSIVECDITAKYDADTKLYVDVRAPIPSYPTDGGLYLFRATVVDNIVTYDWVPISLASGGSF